MPTLASGYTLMSPRLRTQHNGARHWYGIENVAVRCRPFPDKDERESCGSRFDLVLLRWQDGTQLISNMLTSPYMSDYILKYLKYTPCFRLGKTYLALLILSLPWPPKPYVTSV